MREDVCGGWYLAIDLGSELIAAALYCEKTSSANREDQGIDIVNLIPLGVENEMNNQAQIFDLLKKLLETNKIRIADVEIREFPIKDQFEKYKFAERDPSGPIISIFDYLESRKLTDRIPNPKYMVYVDSGANQFIYTNTLRSKINRYLPDNLYNQATTLVSLLLVQITRLALSKSGVRWQNNKGTVIYSFPNVYPPNLINNIINQIKEKAKFGQNVELKYTYEGEAVGAYVFTKKQQLKEKAIMVIDIGKGTTDITILSNISGQDYEKLEIYARTGITKGGGFLSFLIATCVNRIWNDALRNVRHTWERSKKGKVKNSPGKGRAQEHITNSQTEQEIVDNITQPLKQLSLLEDEVISTVLPAGQVYSESKWKRELQFKEKLISCIEKFIEQFKRDLDKNYKLPKESVKKLKHLLSDCINSISYGDLPEGLNKQTYWKNLSSEFIERMNRFIDAHERKIFPFKRWLSQLIVPFYTNKLNWMHFDSYIYRLKLIKLVKKELFDSIKMTIDSAFKQADHIDKIQHNSKQPFLPDYVFLAGRASQFKPLDMYLKKILKNMNAKVDSLIEKQEEIADLKLACVRGAYAILSGNYKLDEDIPLGEVIITLGADTKQYFIYSLRNITSTSVVYKSDTEVKVRANVHVNLHFNTNVSMKFSIEKLAYLGKLIFDETTEIKSVEYDRNNKIFKICVSSSEQCQPVSLQPTTLIDANLNDIYASLWPSPVGIKQRPYEIIRRWSDKEGGEWHYKKILEDIRRKW